MFELRQDHATIASVVAVQRSGFRRSAVKLGINAGLAAGGVLASPVTLGFSLMLTIVGVAMLAWDTTDLVRERKRMSIDLATLRRIQSEAREIEDLQRQLLEELLARTE